MGDQAQTGNMKDRFACFELALAFYDEANRAVQAEVWFAAAAVAAAALEAMLLAKMFTNTEEVAQLASFKKLLAKHRGDFGNFARKKMDLGKLLDMAKGGHVLMTAQEHKGNGRPQSRSAGRDK